MLPLINMKFLNKPNLPENKVSIVAVSEEANEAICYFKNNNIETLLIKRNGNLPGPVQAHPDMQMFHTKNNLIISSAHLFEGHKEFISIQSGEELKPEYPGDVLFNACIIGKKIILNEKTVSRKIVEFADKAGLIRINVNQGYTKCSVCPIDENSLITDDYGIFSAAQNFFNDVLLISKNSIRLEGYDYGFFGGCCGKIDKDKLAVNGRIESHKDKYRIIDFIKSKNVDIIEISDKPLNDIGSIIPLAEFD